MLLRGPPQCSIVLHDRPYYSIVLHRCSPSFPKGREWCGLVWVGVETQTPFLQITRLLVEAREEIPRPRWTFFPPFNFCNFAIMKKCRCRIVVLLLLCLGFLMCSAAVPVLAVYMRRSCLFVLVHTYRTIVHTDCAALFCSVLQVTIHTSLLVHMRTGAQHHTFVHNNTHVPHMRRHDTYRRTSSVPSQKKPLTSPTANHHGNTSSIPA